MEPRGLRGATMRRVLVVDDDLGTRETYQTALRHAAYDVEVADSGSAAISALSSGRTTHGLLLDLKLGDMTGFDVLRWMRAKPLVVPTAVMTAFSAEFEADEAIALGALAYADQPLSIDDILSLARTLTEPPPTSSDDPSRLHACYLAGDPGALDVLVSVWLTALPPRLERSFPRVPWDFAADAITDACLEYAANPARFDASRSSSIVDFVFLIARRNLANRLRSEAAVKNRESRYADEQPRITPSEPNTGDRDIDLWASMMELTTDVRERRAAELWLEGGGNDVIAEALGQAHLPLQDRRREARRFKDRVLKRLSRHFRTRPDR